MERNREVRRSNTTAAALNSSSGCGGLSRRRYRASPAEEEGSKRDLLNRRKRRKSEEEESSEESYSDEEDYEAPHEDVPSSTSSRLLSQNNATSSSSSSSSPLNHHPLKVLPPSRLVNNRSSSMPHQQLKPGDEMIGVPVPRKARSASLKRSHETWVAGNGGLGEDQTLHRRASMSPASRSTEADSSSSLNVSMKKKKKKLRPNGLKTKPPKVLKTCGSSSVQEDIEIEIAEVLFGLKKQSQSSEHEENIDNSAQKLESKHANGISISHESKYPVTNSDETAHQAASVLPQINRYESNPPGYGAPKKLKMVDEKSSIVCAVKAENGQQAKGDDSLQKEKKISGVVVEMSDAAQGLGASVASVSVESLDKAVKRDSKLSAEASCVVDRAVTKEQSVSSKEESSTKLDIDSQNSTVTKVSSSSGKTELQSEEKFKIDLMAPPPMVSSPEREGFIDLAMDLLKAETLVNEEVKVVADEDATHKKTEIFSERGVLPGSYFAKPSQDGSSVSNGGSQQQSHQQQHLAQANIPKLDKTSQSGLLPLPIAVTGWPNGLTPLGYGPSVQTVMPSDGNAGSSAAVQPSQPFTLQPRTKRCARHYNIARIIHLHKQVAKMNNLWPTTTAPTSLTKPGNMSFMPSTERMLLGNPLQGNFPIVSLNSAQEKAQPIANIPVFSKKDNSDAVSFIGSSPKKQSMVQHSSQPAAAGNLLHGPAFVFPLSHQQAAATSNKSGPSKAVNLINNMQLSSNSASGFPATSTALPGVAAAMSFNYPNLAPNDTSYYTIVPNNGYPFPISNPVGTPGQALPLINGSFYSPQMFHHQLPPKQTNSQPTMQPTQQNTSTSSGSSSSHKQTQMQQHARGAQVNGSNYFTSANMKLPQMQKQPVPPSQQSWKLEAEVSWESTPSVADNPSSNVLKGTYGTNVTVPLQPVNFALIPSATVSMGLIQGEKQPQQSQQKNLKGGAELAPPQPFAISFASFDGGNTPSNLNFASMAQNPTIFQSFPDVVRMGYQVTPTPQTPQQKSHMLPDGKVGGSSANQDEGKKILTKSGASTSQTLVFDNSAKVLNFVSSSVAGAWPPHYTTSAAITTNSPGANNSQQQQLLQLQKQQQLLQLQKQHHQIMQHQHNGAVCSKGPITNSHPSSSVSPKFSANYHPISSQTLIQGNAPSYAWSNSTKGSVAVSNSATIKSTPQQQLRGLQGHTQLSFAGTPKSSLASSQGQAMHTTSQSLSPLVVGSPTSGGNLRSISAGSKGGSPAPTQLLQQTENSPNTGQKTSPVCGRNVPSILSTYPSHLSELKY